MQLQQKITAMLIQMITSLSLKGKSLGKLDVNFLADSLRGDSFIKKERTRENKKRLVRR